LYGTASLKGYSVQDTVCLREDICAKTFEWFEISQAYGLPDDCSGILGLSREGSAEMPSGPRLLDELIKQGVIDRNMFSFYMSGAFQGGESFLDIGDPVTEHMKQSQIAWINMDSHFYWMSNKATGIRFENDHKEYRICDSTICPVVFDSGTSVNFMPASIWD